MSENLPAVKAPTFGARMALERLEDALRFAEIVVKSGLAPRGLSAEGVVVAMQMGYEVGMSPLQAIQSIAVVNGRPAIWGDAMLALVRASGLLEDFKEELVGESGTDSRGYRCTVTRKGYPPASEEFTVADAKRAGLWGKPGPWTQYPQRMLRFRARGFVLRDQFGDILRGLRSAEEVMDIEDVVEVAGAVQTKADLIAKAPIALPQPGEAQTIAPPAMPEGMPVRRRGRPPKAAQQPPEPQGAVPPPPPPGEPSRASLAAVGAKLDPEPPPVPPEIATPAGEAETPLAQAMEESMDAGPASPAEGDGT